MPKPPQGRNYLSLLYLNIENTVSDHIRGAVYSETPETSNACDWTWIPRSAAINIKSAEGRHSLAKIHYTFKITKSLKSEVDLSKRARQKKWASVPFKFFLLTPASCKRSDYTYINSLDVCLKISTTVANFADARLACQSDDGDLLMMKSEGLKLYLQENLNGR